MQRPDKELTEQVWATGMIHSNGYQGELAYTMNGGERVPLTASDIAAELHKEALRYYKPAGLTAAEQDALRETKGHIRRAIESLEEQGVCERRRAEDDKPVRELSADEQQRLSHGKVLLYFWHVPRNANPDLVRENWRIQSERLVNSEPETRAQSLVALGDHPMVPSIPPIKLILKTFGISGLGVYAHFANPAYTEPLARAWENAKKSFIAELAPILEAIEGTAEGTPTKIGEGPTAGTLEGTTTRTQQAPVSLYATNVVINKSPSSGRAENPEQYAPDRPQAESLNQTPENQAHSPFPEWHGQLREILESCPVPTPIDEPMFHRIAAHLSAALLPQFKQASEHAKIRKWSGYEAIAKQVATRGPVKPAKPADDLDSYRMRKLMEERAGKAAKHA